MATDKIEIKVGDTMRGTGGLGVLVKVDAIDGDTAACTLVRSGTKKPIKLATLRKSYRVVSTKGEPPTTDVLKDRGAWP